MQELNCKIALLAPELRSAIYEAFAAAYTTLPALSSLAHLRDLGNDLATHFDEGSYAALAVVAGQSYEDGLRDSLDAITQEYYDLFFVPSSARYVPPFESAAISKVLWGRETIHCAECYKAVSFDPFGLDIFPPLKEQGVPDHIGLQLAFSAFLTKMDAESKASPESALWRNLELQFLQEHLLNWVPSYAEALKKRSDTFYSALTAALADFLAMDALALQHIQRKRGELN